MLFLRFSASSCITWHFPPMFIHQKMLAQRHDCGGNSTERHTNINIKNLSYFLISHFIWITLKMFSFVSELGIHSTASTLSSSLSERFEIFSGLSLRAFMILGSLLLINISGEESDFTVATISARRALLTFLPPLRLFGVSGVSKHEPRTAHKRRRRERKTWILLSHHSSLCQ